MRFSHLSSGPCSLVYFLLFSQDPMICHLAAKFFSFPGGSNGQKDRTISILLPWFRGCPEPAVQPGLLSPSPTLTVPFPTCCFRWSRNRFSSRGGKPLWIDPHDPSVHHIFIDDNIRLDDADTIVHPQVGG